MLNELKFQYVLEENNNFLTRIYKKKKQSHDIYLVEVIIIDIVGGRVRRPVLLIVRTVHIAIGR